MCLPTNKPSLIKAVGNLLVNEFVTSGKMFTAHDVTKRLREHALNHFAAKDQHALLFVDPKENGTVWVQGQQVARIEHEDVKAIVHELFNTGGMQGIDRINENGRWEYDTVANIAARNPAPFVATSVSIGVDPAAPGGDKTVTAIVAAPGPWVVYDGDPTI